MQINTIEPKGVMVSPEITKNNAIEQGMLKVSFCAVIVIAVGSVITGLILDSEVVILNGIFSMFSLMGSGLSLLASQLVVRPADRRFQFGYWHVEPLVHCVNATMVAIICLYSLISGIEGIRHGGRIVDAVGVIWFSVITGLICGTVGGYELILSKRIGSQLLRNDAREWLMDCGFSVITLLGFLGLFVLPESYRATWAYYADSAMVAVMSLAMMPFPIAVLRDNIKEVLRMTSFDDPVSHSVRELMRNVKLELDLKEYTSHVLKVGRTYFVEVNVIVDDACSLKSVEEQDKLRQRIFEVCGLSLEELWISVCVTKDPRWS